MPPVAAFERAFETHLFEQFSQALSGRLVKPLAVRLHTSYCKNIYAHLPILELTGYDAWYIEVQFATRPGDEIQDLQIVANGIEVIPFEYGSNVSRTAQIKIIPLKRQTNHIFRINHLKVSGRVFSEVLHRLGPNSELPQPLIANFAPGPNIAGCHVVAYDHMLNGSRRFCSCAHPAHVKIFNRATEITHKYSSGSWPEALIA